MINDNEETVSKHLKFNPNHKSIMELERKSRNITFFFK